MIKVLSTREVAAKTGLTDRSVRRRIDSNQIKGVTVAPANGGRAVKGVTEKALNEYLSKVS